jgi:hypothetical protein
MATLVLQAAGSALGSALGGPLGAVLGRVAGAVAGAAIDSALTGERAARHVEGPRLIEMPGLGSTEGAPIPRAHGRVRLGGELIWATRYEEEALVSVERSGGGGKGGGARTVETDYAYYANLAVGLCEGPIAFVRRVWADGEEIDLTAITMRLHRGHGWQMPDPLILAKEGDAPAYRGLAYVVFERLPLARFGNRIPQFAFEVVKPVAGGLGETIRAVDLIPGASEFAYDTRAVSRIMGLGATAPENRNQLTHWSDLEASLDQLAALCPNLEAVALVVSWFGDDLRAGACSVAPRVDLPVKQTDGATWRVAGLERGAARVVSSDQGRAAYGGTPSDHAVRGAIAAIRARGWKVLFYPFLMMDVPAGNTLTDPWTGAASQPAYPWRGRITCDPAPGRPGSPDATPLAGDQVAAFFGTASASDFAVDADGEVVYSGPDEWSWRRMVLHCAHLCASAGGVDAFLVGTEFASLTRVRSGPGVYPAAGHFAALAAQVKTVLGPVTKISYAADWTEYGAHVLDGGQEIRFPLDSLWASPAIDAVAIDAYWPLADWRDGEDHHDATAARSIHDPAYLAANVAGGEGFDWYYPDAVARYAQNRVTITDGAYGKPWVYRVKDLPGWWGNPHHERVGGVEMPVPTGWLPGSKPVWLTEIGVPAVDKGPNQPNVFPDPKSSENAWPVFSTGARDDLVQARALAAFIAHHDPAAPGFAEAANPLSPVYGGRMLDPGDVFVWAWDARPFPAFPMRSDVWADGLNWERGHWITGRLEGLDLARLVPALLAEFGVTDVDASRLDGFLDGYVIDRPMSAREALEPLMRLFGVEASMAGGRLRLVPRGERPVAVLGEDDLVPARDGTLVRRLRAEETALPREVRLSFIEAERDFRRAIVSSRRLPGASGRQASAEIGAVLRREQAQGLADFWLADLWTGRETAEFELSPARLALEPGDVVTIEGEVPPREWRIERIVDGATRRIEARAVARHAAPPVPAEPDRTPPQAPLVPGKPAVLAFDPPFVTGEPPVLQALAVAAEPWPGALALHRASGPGAFELAGIARAPAILVQTLEGLGPGPLWRFDAGNALSVRVSSGGLYAASDEAVLNGANRLALRHPDGAFEVIGFAHAELVGERTFRLSRLLRGLGGCEPIAARTLGPGAPGCLIDAALMPVARGRDALGRTDLWRVGPAGRDVAHPAMAELAAGVSGAALMPLSPVRARATRTPDGILVTWLRRSRIEADGWEQAEIPLGEEVEAYEIDILDGGEVRRTLAAAASPVLYASTDEIADFGATRTVLSLRIVQLSAAIGRGHPLLVTLPVTG